MISNGMRVLREFVEEFSPIHAGFIDELTYEELFDIVAEVVESHYEGSEEEDEKNNEDNKDMPF